MKCRLCYKKIPKDEEIIEWGGSGSRYSTGGGGACCEDCHRKRHSPNGSPLVILIIFLITLFAVLVIFLVYWQWTFRKEKKIKKLEKKWKEKNQGTKRI